MIGRRFAVGIVSCAVVHVASAQRVAKPVIDTINHHIVRVMNRGPVAWSDTNGWSLVLDRTVQPAEGSPGMLEKPQQLVMLPDGRIIVAQRNPATIKVYDRQGRFRYEIGREGEGPGEFRAPQLALYRDTLVVHDGRLGRATLFALDGRFVRQFPTGIHSDGPPISADDRGRLRVQNPRRSVSAFQAQWVYFDMHGRQLDSILPPEVVHPKTWDVKLANGGAMSEGVPFSPYNAYAFRHDGSIVYGGTDRYQLAVTRTGRDTVLIFGRSHAIAEPIPAGLRDSMFAPIGSMRDLKGIAFESDMPRVYPVWNGVSLDGSGNAWVETGRRENHTTRFDVFNPAGAYLGAVAAPFEGFWRAFWSGDRIAVLETDTSDMPIIRVYRVDRRGH